MPLNHPHTEEAKQKIRAAKLGVPRSEDVKQKLRDAWKARAPITEETRERMRLASTGRTKSPETRAKISQAKLGVPRSPETVAKMSAAMHGKKLRLGAKHTEETKQLLREINTGKIPAALVERGLTQEQYDEAKATGLSWCSVCKSFQSEFCKGNSRCVACNRNMSVEHRAARTPEEIETDNQYGTDWRDKNADRVRRHWLKARYAVTPEWYEEKFAEQGGHCALCEAIVDGRRMPTHAVRGLPRQYLLIDHDHETGKARGLLCAKCNTALHRVEYIKDWATKALSYLARYTGVT